MGSETVYVVGSDPDVLDKREPTGCLRRLGVGLVVAGGGWLALMLEAHEAGRLGGGAGFLVAGGALALVAGAFCLLVRGGTFLDRRRRVQVSWWSVLGLGRRRETSFAGTERVEVEKDSGDSDSPTTYPARLVGPEGVEPLRLDAPTDYQQARRAAEAVARFLTLPLHDRSAGEVVVRQPAELDEPLRSRIRRTGGPPELPAAPVAPRAQVEQTHEGLRVEIVGAGPSAAAWLPVGCAVLFAAFVGLTFWSGATRSPRPLVIAVGVFVAVPILAALGTAVRHVLQRTVVVAGRLGLRVEQAFLLGRKVIEIPADELEELVLLRPDAPPMPEGAASADEWRWSLEHGRMPDGREASKVVRWAWRLAGSQGITARSDRVSVTFGAGLPPEELAYLHALLLRELA